MSTHNIIHEIDRFGIDIELDIVIRLTSLGSPPSWDDPGDGPEWEIESCHTMEARLALDVDADLTQDERDAIDDLVANNVGDWIADEEAAADEWMAELRLD